MVCEFLNIFSLGFLLLLYVTIELTLMSMRVIIRRPMVVVCNSVNCFLLAIILLGVSFLTVFVFFSIHFCASLYVCSI